MESKLAKFISCKLVQQGIIDPEFEEVYVYGLELVLSFIISTSIILLIGVLSRNIGITLTFLLIFIALRRFTGGFHAATYLKCKIWTVSTYFIVLLLSIFCNIPIWSYLPLSFLGFVFILLFGPIENIHKPLTKAIKKKNKILSLILFSALIVFGLIIHLQIRQLSNAVFYTLVSVIVLMIIPILQKGGCSNEKKNRQIGS